MIPFAVGFTAGFLVCACYAVFRVRGLRRMIVADRKAALKQAQWRAGQNPDDMPVHSFAFRSTREVWP